MKSFFSSAVSWSQCFSTSFGHGGSLVSFGITPSRFWFSKMRSRSLFQPSSKSFIALILSTHSLVGWCGACVAPGAYLMKIGLLGSDLVHPRHVVDRVVGHRR